MDVVGITGFCWRGRGVCCVIDVDESEGDIEVGGDVLLISGADFVLTFE